jgi:FKBP-type peptidyl-prolyl cis-trans isomerase
MKRRTRNSASHFSLPSVRSRGVFFPRMKTLAALAAAAIVTAVPASAQVGKEKGEAFLAENAKKEGVKVLPSGLQYKVVKEGTGKQPGKTDTARVHYKGTLIDGKEFDSSYKRGEPAEFPVGRVIKGWTEALQLMKVGAKWQLFIPAALAYGERGAGDLIGPNETLVFEVELLDVK